MLKILFSFRKFLLILILASCLISSIWFFHLKASFRNTTPYEISPISTELNVPPLIYIREEFEDTPQDFTHTDISFSGYPKKCDRVVPSFIIVGARKCGTTSLYEYMLKHPQILGLSSKSQAIGDKEIRFFSSINESWTVDMYMNNFMPVSEIPTKLDKKYVTGEASPNYILSNRAPAKIFTSFPGMKLIFLLRNPIDRAYSQFNHILRIEKAVKDEGKYTRNYTFETLVNEEMQIIENCKFNLLGNNDWTRYLNCHDNLARRAANKLAIPMLKNLTNTVALSLLSEGLYAFELYNYIKYFNGKNMMVIQSESFYQNTSFYLDKIMRFVGVERLENWDLITKNIYNFEENSHIIASNQTSSYNDIGKELRSKLNKFFRPYNEEIQKLFVDEFPLWS